jgi:WD40 repeat protein/energy-coupling factor transporter ATP-binding protein EcfA2
VSAPAIGTIQPYIGLRYFEERDAHLFYGRDEHVSELLAKVAQNRFVAIMGSSGCGKSSLVRAGLLPELRSGMIPKAGRRWKVVAFRPGRAPLQELSLAIRSELGVEHALELVEQGPLGIARAVAEAKLAAGTNVLVIADQYEEVFRFQLEEATHGRSMQAAEQCQALTRRLLDAVAQAELPIYVLLVMRSDYLGECAQFPDLPERMSESLYLVPRLRRDQLQEAITAPVGGVIEPAVVQRLLSEVGSDPDQLPRLQHLLARMWDRKSDGHLTMEQYNGAGGWKMALEKHLEEVYLGLSESQQIASGRVFQQLSELDKGRAVRRRVEMGELIEVCGSDAVDVVGRFRAEGFVTPRENPVDITHECILREWPRLREWLQREDRNAKRLRELAEAAKDAGWTARMNQEQPVRELAGLTLQNLVTWRDEAQPTAAWARRYITPVDFDTAYGYLLWSEECRKRQQDLERRRTRFIRVLLVITVVAALCLAAVFGILNQRANGQKRIADSLKLAARATAEQWLDPRASREDVLSALALARTDKAEEALNQVISQSNLKMVLKDPDQAPLSAAAFSRDGRLLFTSNLRGRLRIWDLRSGKPIHELQIFNTYRISTQSLSPSSPYLLTSTWNDPGGGVIQVTNTETWRTVAEFVASSVGPIASAVFSPSGRYIATTGQDYEASIWDLESIIKASNDSSNARLVTLEPLKRRRLHQDIVNSIRFGPNDDRVITSSQDGRAKIWNWRSNIKPLELRAYSTALFSAEFNPKNSDLVITGGQDGTVRMWRVDAQGQINLLWTKQWHKLDVRQASFDPSGERNVAASLDGTATVWDSTFDRYTLEGHRGGLTGACFDPFGRQIVTTSADGTARIWTADPVSDRFTTSTVEEKVRYLRALNH